jgi:hypothetical protein
MNDKEAVLELVKRLPADRPLRDILREVESIAAVKEKSDGLQSEPELSVSVEKMTTDATLFVLFSPVGTEMEEEKER